MFVVEAKGAPGERRVGMRASFAFLFFGLARINEVEGAQIRGVHLSFELLIYILFIFAPCLSFGTSCSFFSSLHYTSF